MKSKLFLSVVLSLFIWGCAPPPLVPRKVAKPPVHPATAAEKQKEKEKEKEAEKPEEKSSTAVQHAVFIRVHPEGDSNALVKYLTAHPALKLTVIFPAGYFDSDKRRSDIAAFRVLVASKQIEIGLVLDNEPILPLLGDLSRAEETADWKFNFKRPEDISAQIARASARYQKRWQLLPSGTFPPYGALSEDVMQSVRQFRLSWVLAEPDEESGVKFFGATGLLKPPLAAADSSAGDLAKLAMSAPFVFIDFSNNPASGKELEFLSALSQAVPKNPALPPLLLGDEFIQSVHDEYELPKGAEAFRTDYNEWVRSPLQKRAWQALAEARTVLDNYKDSGRAKLKLLDAAVDEMCNAESGPFLRDLGRDDYTPGSERERNFVATLANIYRLCGEPVPDSLDRIFSTKATVKTTKKTENDRPFFVEGPQSLIWNDPSGDDNGGGSFTYPSGKYPKGAFDLREVIVSWDDEKISFSVGVVDMPWKKTSLVMPLMDVYIDLNRLEGAGATQPLKKRNLAAIQSNAAWEYAVTLGVDDATLYQAIPGSDARVLQHASVALDGNAYVASFPRTMLRGNPEQWRLSVGLMGQESGTNKDSAAPVSILPQSDGVHFGGASGGRFPSPYFDLLAETIEDQERRINSYENGAKVLLPYVEVP